MKLFSNTNWNLYRSFIVVYEAGSYLRAESIIGIARNNIKSNITSLSDQLGVELFKSHSKGVTPTSAANEIYPIIKRAIALITESENSLKTFDKDTNAIIKLAVPSSWASYLFSDFMIAFCKEYPNIVLELYKKEAGELLAQRKIDIAIGIKQQNEQQQFQSVNLFKEKFVFISSKKYLTENGLDVNLSIKDLEKIPLIAQQEMLALIESEIEGKLNPTIRATTTEQVYAIIKKGFGVGLYWDKTLDEERRKLDGIVKLKIEGQSDISREFSCTYSKEALTRAAEVFLEKLKQFCNDYF